MKSNKRMIWFNKKLSDKVSAKINQMILNRKKEYEIKIRYMVRTDGRGI